MNKRGFTLIELLAVIVILAIIALIATPIVLNIIKDSRESAGLRSAEMYLDAVEQSISIKKMDNPSFKPSICVVQEDGNLNCEGTNVKVEVDGALPAAGSIITFEEGRITEINLKYSNDKIIVKDTENNLEYKNYTLINNYQHKHTNGTIENHEVTFDSNGHGKCLKCREEVLAPGIYGEDGNMTKSWQELLDEEVIFVTDGALTTHINVLVAGSNPSSDILDGKLVIADGVTLIKSTAFSYCTKLTSVVIPNSVISIENNGFGGCTGLESITIPSSVTSIGQTAFSSCTSLTSVIVDKNNAIYDSRDNSNAIIETATNTLVSGCKNTNIPDSVVGIKGYAFYGQSTLTSITIPTNITSIQDYAFSYCTGLANINYSGTQAQWNQISKGSNWNKDSIEMKVNCTDGTITVAKNETQWGPLW